MRIAVAAQARAVVMPVETSSPRSWLAARAAAACLVHLRAPGVGPVLSSLEQDVLEGENPVFDRVAFAM